MKYISEKQFDREMASIKKTNLMIERHQALREEKNKYRKKFKMPSTTKMVMFYLFLLFNVVLVFSMYAMWHFADLSYLGVLVTDIAAQLLTFLIYTIKSTKENTKGGITYDMAMNSGNMYEENETMNI